MGKGDRRSKRGKIFQGTSGKTRPKGKTKKKKNKSGPAEAAESTEKSQEQKEG